MALKLRIVNDIAVRTGAEPRSVFGVNGGRIGRSDDNDWVLPDPKRYVSGHHAEIEHRGGEWYIRDLSTNGTFVNDSRRPIGPGGRFRLSAGDRVRIGEYDLAVDITTGNDFHPDESLEIDFGSTMFEGDSVGMRSLLSVDATGDQVRPADAYGQPLPGNTDRMRRAEVAAKPQARAPGAEDRELWPGLVALCKGAGLDPYALPAETRAQALQEAGQLLREMLVGMTELARSRAQFAREVGIDGGRREGTGHFAQVTVIEDALIELLSGQGSSGGRAVDEIRGQFTRSRHHDEAVLAALRSALPAMLEKLDPDELEQQFGRTARAAAGGDAYERYWTRFREMHRAVVTTGDNGLPPAFVQEFVRAYLERAVPSAPAEPAATRSTRR